MPLPGLRTVLRINWMRQVLVTIRHDENRHPRTSSDLPCHTQVRYPTQQKVKFRISRAENTMSTDTWNAVDDYFSRGLVKSDAALDAALEASTKAGLRAINVAPNQGEFLNLLAKIH